jgi:HupE / UreJ protein
MTVTLRAVLWLLSFGILGFASTTAGAHSLGASYLTIEAAGNETGIAAPPPAISGQWEIFLDDVQTLVNLDADDDLEITVAEFEQARERIEQAVLPTLTVRRGGGACTLDVHDQLVNQRLEGFYAVLMFRGECESGGPLTLQYGLLFDVDRSHRAVLTIRDAGREHAAVLTPDAPRWADPSRWRMLASFIRQGTHHIWIGYDHVAFLVLLLLPAALRSRQGTWEGAPSWRSVTLRTLGIVTAFTIAHSITLSLAVLGIAVPPERPIEIAIAASVVLAGLANLVPRLAERAAWIAFAFGLIHGFGFANVLRELGLTSDTLAVSLAGFNVGVELGQLAIVAVLLPLLYRVRDAAFYRRRFVPAASIATALLALGWLLERTA